MAEITCPVCNEGTITGRVDVEPRTMHSPGYHDLLINSQTCECEPDPNELITLLLEAQSNDADAAYDSYIDSKLTERFDEY